MSKNLHIIFSAILLFAGTQSSQSAVITGSTFNIYFSDGGNGSTAVSWNVTGDLAGSGVIMNFQNSGWGGFYYILPPAYFTGGIFTESSNLFINSWNQFSLNGGTGGTFTNLSGSGAGGSGPFYSSSATIKQIVLGNGSGTNVVAFGIDKLLGYSKNNIITYTPAQDSGTIAVPISCFNAGSYQYILPSSETMFSTPITYNLTVTRVVPEPSTYVLFGIGAVGMLMAMRRKKTS